ncbi:MAG: hydrogenase maturation nickel metallochaperone HypA [Synergistaceae bacterium]|nr:hydrogenase maturation nickel metallochaperone HypA [Synergistaceae bacterium]
MHELSLVMSVVKTITNLCEQNKWKRVLRVTIKVGHLRQIEPEIFAFAFSSATAETMLEGAEISIIEMPIIFKCHSCKKSSDTEDFRFVCPNCGSLDVDLISGMEFVIESIEIGG